MFEKEIQTAKHRLSSQLLTDKTYVYLQDVLTHPDVHDFYKQFFRGEVEWWIYEQQMLREANPRFHYADETFAAALVHYDEQCKRTARFDHGELVSLIDLAVKTRVNYLLRPRTTLKWFVYRGEPTKSLREVLLRCAYFSCYNYLIDEFDKWAENKSAENAHQDILSVIEFERLIEHIDNEIILEHTTSEFTELLAPLYDFFDELQPEEGQSAIPTPALIIFLDDKGILRISQELERLMKEDELHSITRSEFLNVIDSVISQVEEETGVQGYGQDSTIPLDFDHTVLQRQEEANNEQNGSNATTDSTERATDTPSEVKEEGARDNAVQEKGEEGALDSSVDGGTNANVSGESTAEEDPMDEVPNATIAEDGGLAEQEEAEYTTAVEDELAEANDTDDSDAMIEEIEERDEPTTYADVSDIAVIQEGEAVAIASSDEHGDVAIVEQAATDIAVGAVEEIGETETVAIEHDNQDVVFIEETEEGTEAVFEDVSVVEEETATVEVQQADYSTLTEDVGEELLDSESSEDTEDVPVAEEEQLVVDVSVQQPMEQEDTAIDAGAEDEGEMPLLDEEDVVSESEEEGLAEVEGNTEFLTPFAEEADVIDEAETEEDTALLLDIEDVVSDSEEEELAKAEENVEFLTPFAEEDTAPLSDIEGVVSESEEEGFAEAEENAEFLTPFAEEVDAIDEVETEEDTALLLDIEDVVSDSEEEELAEVEENAEPLTPFAEEADVIDEAETEEDTALLLDIEDVVLDSGVEELATAEEYTEDIGISDIVDDGAIVEDRSGGETEVQGADAVFFAENDTRDTEEKEARAVEPISDVVEEESAESEQTGVPALYPPVQALIDDNLQQRVLKHVFHHNEEQLLVVLDQVNATQSWREASVLIDRVFMENEVDPYSSIAKKFSDVVYERFL